MLAHDTFVYVFVAGSQRSRSSLSAVKLTGIDDTFGNLGAGAHTFPDGGGSFDSPPRLESSVMKDGSIVGVSAACGVALPGAFAAAVL
jgi:hypothetical protein